MCGGEGAHPVLSEEPEFPASVFFGVSFGLAFRGGREGLLGVRQGGEVGVVRGAKSLHQRLQFVLLQLEIQLHTTSKQKEHINTISLLEVELNEIYNFYMLLAVLIF